MMLVLLLIQFVVGERRIGRRAERPTVAPPSIALAQT